MKRFPVYRLIVVMCLSMCAIISGCASRNTNTYGERPTPETTANVGHNMQARGIMTSVDNQHLEQLGDKVRKEKRLDDRDIDWAIATMHKSSSDPAIVHTGVMALFLDMQTMTQPQRNKIRNAVTPLLSSQDTLDQKYARAVIKKVS